MLEIILKNMNPKYPISSIVLVILSIVSLNAQTIRYDTVPNPEKANQQLFKVEYPETQQSQAANQQQVTSPEQHSGFDKNKLVIGGTFGFSLGDYTSLNISPQVGYQINKFFTWGGGIGYNYYKWDNYNVEDLSYNYLGFNMFGRVTPIRAIALQVQPEIYRLWGSQVKSQNVHCILAGGGIYIPAGRGAMSAMIYYDLLQEEYSPYRDQIVYTVGYVFSF